MKTTVEEFLRRCEDDIDVYDDYDERCGVAYCPPTYLTAKGRVEFEHALELSVEWEQGGAEATVECATHVDANATARLFYSLAGYCADDDWNKWFTYEEELEGC